MKELLEIEIPTSIQTSVEVHQNIRNSEEIWGSQWEIEDDTPNEGSDSEDEGMGPWKVSQSKKTIGRFQ